MGGIEGTCLPWCKASAAQTVGIYGCANSEKNIKATWTVCLWTGQPEGNFREASVGPCGGRSCGISSGGNFHRTCPPAEIVSKLNEGRFGSFAETMAEEFPPRPVAIGRRARRRFGDTGSCSSYTVHLPVAVLILHHSTNYRNSRLFFFFQQGDVVVGYI